MAVDGAAPAGRYDVHGPARDSEAVEVWSDHYIRFEPTPWQKQLRDQIRHRCRQLEPSAGQVLQAEFFGAKLPNADVENLVLYNIDSFAIAGSNGIRFEHGGMVPAAPNGAEYRFCYRYALAPRSGCFTHWRQGRELAQFDWTDLGSFAGEKKLAQVWLAIARGQNKVGERVLPATSFGVRVEVRPPFRLSRKPVWGGLVKGIFDGVICAFQANTGPPLPPGALERLAKDLGVPLKEIETLLDDPPWSVLGEVPGLVSPYRGGVKWAPSDHLCVAGELLAVEPKPGDDRWAITGRVFELSR